MCKLYTGSLGTLGILSELTFKVQPRPDNIATVFLAYPSIALALEATQSFMKSDLLPDSMEAWNREALLPLSGFAGSPEAAWVLMIRFGEVEPAVRWQLERLKEIAPGSGGEVLDVLSMEQSEQFWEKASSAREAADGSEETLVKCSVLYRSVPETARQLLDTGARLGAHTMLYCHAGTYVLYARYRWDNGCKKDWAELREAFRALRSFCQAEGGHTVVEKTNPEVKNGLDIWGYDGSALHIMRRIKEEFDPKGLLNPGRFVGGI
jgi:glycolate oxidase FAD binding subunit